MPQLPRGVPFVDLLIPPGSGDAVASLQTRFELAGGGGWRIVSDDGTMETSSLPMGPLRGDSDRVWAYRTRPWTPGESLGEGASMAMELAMSLQAKVAALGVNGTYAWGLVMAEDVRWLHGLVLLDWLYNPRLSEVGDVLEKPDDHAAAQERLPKKLAVFDALWTPERSMAFGRALPPGALQPLEGLYALPLLGPSGDFDPRYWQGFALQIAVAEVKAYADANPDGAPPSKPRAAAPEAAPAVPEDDGLTPLARAQAKARQEAAQRAQAGAEAPPPPPVVAPDGAAIRWVDGDSGALLVVPVDRYDAGLIRDLRRGSVGDLPNSERPPGRLLEQWMAAGAPFVSEVPLFSRLFLDNKPLHRGAFEAAADAVGELRVLRCQLPRVAPVVAVLVPQSASGKRRILVCSDRDLAPAVIVAAAG